MALLPALLATANLYSRPVNFPRLRIRYHLALPESLSPAYFTQHDVLKVYSHCGICQHFLSFSGWIASSHRRCGPKVCLACMCWWTLVWLILFPVVSSTSVSMVLQTSGPAYAFSSLGYMPWREGSKTQVCSMFSITFPSAIHKDSAPTGLHRLRFFSVFRQLFGSVFVFNSHLSQYDDQLHFGGKLGIGQNFFWTRINPRWRKLQRPQASPEEERCWQGQPQRQCSEKARPDSSKKSSGSQTSLYAAFMPLWNICLGVWLNLQPVVTSGEPPNHLRSQFPSQWARGRAAVLLLVPLCCAEHPRRECFTGWSCTCEET